MKRVLPIAVLVLIVAFVNAPCRTWFLHPDGSGDAPSIKAAVYYGADGDTVLLADGTFTGRDNTEVSYRGKAIVIMSRSGNPHACVIDCQGSELNWSRGFLFYYGEGKGSVLEGVTVMNGYGYEGGGLWCWASSPTIRHVILKGNEAVYSGGGIYCGGGSSPDLEHVTAFGNTAVYGGGLFCMSASSPVVRNTVIAWSGNGGSVHVEDADCAPVFSCCDIYRNEGGDWVAAIASQYGTDGNISLDPLFCLDENPPEPFTVRSTSPCAPGHHLGCGGMGAAGVGCWFGVEAEVDIEPRTLNPRSRGRWITCYIELQGGLDPGGIDVSTVRLNDSIPAALQPVAVGDHDDDGVGDLMVKFARVDVMGVLTTFGEVEIRVSGEVDGTQFAGTDTVRVLDSGGKSKAVEAGTFESEIVSVLGGDVPGGSARIRFEVSEPGVVSLLVFDVRGRLVTQLVEGHMLPNEYSVDWDGHDNAGSRVARGVYFLRLESEERTSTGKVILVP